MGITNYGAFIVASILLNLIPGSDTIYIISNASLGGRRQGIFSVLGISCGVFVHTLLAAIGLSAILMSSAVVFTSIKWLGSIYLLYLGITTFMKKESLITASKGQQENDWQIFKQGLLTNVLNPKVALFFLSLLPQYIDPNLSSSTLPFLLLGVSFILTNATWSLFVVYGASFFTNLFTKNERSKQWSNKLAGGVYILLGLNLLRASAQSK